MSHGNNADDFSQRIDVLAEYRAKGKDYLKATGEQARLKRAMYELFVVHLTRAYWERVIDGIRREEPYHDPYELVSRHVGKHGDTVERLETGKTSVSLSTYLSTIQVFRLPWECLDVPDRREVIIEAMLAALAKVQAALPGSTRTPERRSAEPQADDFSVLSRDSWELLRRAHHSKAWLTASKDPVEETRRCQMLVVANAILEDFRLDAGRREQPSIDGAMMIQLMERWHRAWTIFFAVVPCRWRF